MINLPFKLLANGIELKIRAYPKAKSNRIAHEFYLLENEAYIKIYISEPPEDGKANKAIIELLAHNFGLGKTIFAIKHGLTTRNKIIFIADDPTYLKMLVSNYFQLLL